MENLSLCHSAAFDLSFRSFGLSFRSEAEESAVLQAGNHLPRPTARLRTIYLFNRLTDPAAVDSRYRPERKQIPPLRYGMTNVSDGMTNIAMG